MFFRVYILVVNVKWDIIGNVFWCNLFLFESVEIICVVLVFKIR